MILLDVNVVLALHRGDHPHHALIRAWFDTISSGKRSFCVPDVVWASFVRIATSRRIFEVPTPIDDAFTFLRAVRSHPGHVAVAPAEEHLIMFEDLCRRFEATGDLAADAYIAAIALEQGSALASLDRDFARFVGLQWVRPGED